VQRVKDPARDPAKDGATVEPQCAELVARDDPMLPAGKCGDCTPSGRWVLAVAFFATFVTHLVRVSGGTLRVGDLCDGGVTSGARGP
jgi:hypothetical protein